MDPRTTGAGDGFGSYQKVQQQQHPEELKGEELKGEEAKGEEAKGEELKETQAQPTKQQQQPKGKKGGEAKGQPKQQKQPKGQMGEEAKGQPKGQKGEEVKGQQQPKGEKGEEAKGQQPKQQQQKKKKKQEKKAANTWSLFNKTLQRTDEWLKDVMQEANLTSIHQAYSLFRGVLMATRDRLPVNEAVHLGAQLPMLVRGFYYENWVPSECPFKEVKTKDDFLLIVKEYSNLRDIEFEECTLGVLRALNKRIGGPGGEWKKIENNLPHHLHQFFQNAEKPRAAATSQPSTV